MHVLFEALLVALLVLGCNTRPGPATSKECEELTKTLHRKELEKILGDWVLVRGTSDFKTGDTLVHNISSSHVELYPAQDNKTVVYNERNMLRNGGCISYYTQVSLHNQSFSNLTLQTDSFFKEHGGNVTVYNDSGKVEFYQTCPDCLVLVYTGVYDDAPGRFLLIYRREGKQQVHEDQKTIKRAKCLHFTTDEHFIYDGVSELCPRVITSPLIKSLQPERRRP